MPGPSLFLNDFTVLDFAFLDRDLGVQGDSYYVSAELFGELDHKDFLFDFGPAKKALKALVDDTFDHKLLVPQGAAAALDLREQPGSLSFRSASDGAEWSYTCPRAAYEVLPEGEISPAFLERHLAERALAVLPANVKEARFFLRSLPRFATEASFRYTHGLRYHDGNCQRLFHGHRNPVEVWVDGQRDAALERRLAGEWNGAHFLAADTLVNRAALDLSLGQRAGAHPGRAEIAYTSAQGRFRALLPASRVILTEGEPSIETMSALGLTQLRAWGVKGALRVVAYEGLNKGASSSSVS